MRYIDNTQRLVLDGDEIIFASRDRSELQTAQSALRLSEGAAGTEMSIGDLVSGKDYNWCYVTVRSAELFSDFCKDYPTVFVRARHAH